MSRFLLTFAAALLLGGCAGRIFDLQGHRGARGLAPENTLPAFERALDLGVRTLELDVAITRDGVVVISHDPWLNPDIARGPDGQWLATRGPTIHSLTFAELQRYDVGRLKPGSAYAGRNPDQVAVDGTRVPRLSDLFDLVRRRGDRWTRFNIETKVSPLAPDETLAPEGFARALVAEIRRGGMQRRASIQSFDFRTLQVVQREAPEIPTVYLTVQRKALDNVCAGEKAGNAAIAPADCGDSPWTAGLRLRDHGSVPKLVKAAGGAAWSPDYRDLDAARVSEAHALGLRVIPWTVNEPDDIKRVLEMGVDGIITDRPDKVNGVRVNSAR
jgi:glycerophosphoryl diester phosphodiesterase